MKIFLTGGSGFIGRNIIEQLGGKYEILAPTHAELELLDAETVSDYLDRNQVDVVLHAAVRPGHRNAKDASNQLDHNCRMFFNLARNSDRFGKMIFLSSGAVYDMRYYQPKMKEEYFDAHVPADEVGFSNISPPNTSSGRIISLNCGFSASSASTKITPFASSPT